MIPVQFKPVIHRYDCVESTNDQLKQLALEGAPEGTLVFAKEQTRGKGRLGRSWLSPAGGLYVSVILYPLTIRRITDLPFLVGVAVVQTLQQFLPKSHQISLKWPNDVLVNNQKVAGILSEAFGDEKFYGGVIGVGLNVNVTAAQLNEFQQKQFKATSLSILLEGEATDIEEVFSVFQAKLFNLYRFYQEKGFAPIQALWEKNCGMLGKKIEVQGVEPKGSTVTGILWGISDRGGLVVDIGQTDKLEILSGELTCCWY